MPVALFIGGPYDGAIVRNQSLPFSPGEDYIKNELFNGQYIYLYRPLMMRDAVNHLMLIYHKVGGVKGADVSATDLLHIPAPAHLPVSMPKEISHG